MKKIKKIGMITIGSMLFAAGISLFIDPCNLAPGGVSGIAILLNRISGVETGTLILLLNIPILMLGVYKFGWRFLVATGYAIVAVSVFTNIFSSILLQPMERLSGALAGAALCAVGMGLVLRCGTTTGGTDIIVKCLRQRYPHMKTESLFFMIDIGIVLLSGFVFRDVDTILYSAIAVFTTSYILDLVLYGKDGAKLLYIISDHAERITERILVELEIGVTHLKGNGAYSKKEKNIILCVIHKQIAHKAEEIVKQEDPEAFMIITGATQIYGEGYKSYFGEIL